MGDNDWSSLFGKANKRHKVPPYISREIAPLDEMLYNYFYDYTEEQKQELARKVSWVYSDIKRIADETKSANIKMMRRSNNSLFMNHPFLKLFEEPNEFFSGRELIEHAIWSLMLSENGAFWFLAPAKSDSNKLMEIWPIPPNKIEPVKDSEQFISYYSYDPGNGGDKLRIDKRYIFRSFFVDYNDLWKSLTPLSAAERGIDIYNAIANSQTSLFSEGGGVPLSIVMIDQNTSNPDFEVIREQIRTDWMNQKRIAVARGNTIDVKNVGISNRDLEILGSQKLNRDEIDSVFMGIPWRNDNFTSGDAIEKANKIIKETVIFPLHQLLANKMQTQIINRFYGDTYVLKFDDVRQQDRALQIQEWNVAWKADTFNEARESRNLPPFENQALPGLGELPFTLATNPQFMIAFLGLTPQQSNQDNVQQLSEPGNVPSSMSPEATTNLVAVGKKNYSIAEKTAIVAELKNYKKVVRRIIERTEKSAGEVNFDSEILPNLQEIQLSLHNVKDLDKINNIFDTEIQKWLD